MFEGVFQVTSLLMSKEVMSHSVVVMISHVLVGIFNWLPLCGGEWQQICHS
jgi:hypothetical protein